MGAESKERGSAEDGTDGSPAKKPRRQPSVQSGGAAGALPVTAIAKARAARAVDVTKTKRTRRGRRRDVSLESLEVARSAGGLMDAWAPVRRCFLRRDAAGWDPLSDASLPPLATMLKGRAGEVRLKIYLTLLWLAAAAPHLVRGKPAQAWARLLGLHEPDSLGATRVRAALTWLEKEGFAYVNRGRGAAAVVGPLHERGSGDAYTRPTGSKDPQDWYIQVPQQFWSEGWISVLSGPAVAVLLVMLDDVWGTDGVRKVRRLGRAGVEFQEATSFPQMWLAESQLRARYGLSWDTWALGIKELVDWGLVTTAWASATVGFGSRHRRRLLRLRLRVLKAGVAAAAGLGDKENA